MKKWALFVFIWFAATFNNANDVAYFMNSKGIAPDPGHYSLTRDPNGLFSLVYWKN